MKDKKAILVISSGTSSSKARKENIESVENRIGEAFEDYEIRRAFTSRKILQRLREMKGIFIDNPTEAIEKIIEDGFQELIIQPLHLIAGEEYERLIEPMEKYKSKFKRLGLGKPLLYDEQDYRSASEALKMHTPKLKENEAVILMAHGSNHTSHECYSKLQRHIDMTGINTYVGTIKGKPGIEDIIIRLKESGIKDVILIPYMLVCGNHAMVDMASKKDTSWKSILEHEDFNVSVLLKGLGESVEYQDIYINKVREAISSIKSI